MLVSYCVPCQSPFLALKVHYCFSSSHCRIILGLFDDNDTSDEPEEAPTSLQAAVDAETVDSVLLLASTAGPADLTAALCRSCQGGRLATVQALLETG
jgi:hypothetical protein